VTDVLQKPAGDYEPKGRLDPAGFEQHVQFAIHPSPDDLAQFIEHFWSIRWDGVDHPYESLEVMHRPYVDLFVSTSESGIQGTFRGKRAYIASGRGRIVGARFRPGAFHAVWDGTLAQLQDSVLDLHLVFPEADDLFVERLLAGNDLAVIDRLGNLIRTRQPRFDPNIELINQIIIALETDEDLSTVAAVAETFGRSERWLQQLFQDYVGIGLKWQLQRHKLLAAARVIRDSDRPDWAAIAYDVGYSSQQHFITHFRKVIGVTPLQYKRNLTRA
jgi:AraC-like DNA-binding protein